MTSFTPPPSNYTFWHMAADFEDAMRALIERGYPLNNVLFTLSAPRIEEEPEASQATPAQSYTLTWASRDGKPLEPPLHQALLDTLPIKPATPQTQNPPEEWAKIYDYLLLRIKAHYSGHLTKGK